MKFYKITILSLTMFLALSCSNSENTLEINLVNGSVLNSNSTKYTGVVVTDKIISDAKDGYLHGSFELYGLKEGAYKFLATEGNYNYGKKDGEFKSYNDDGQLKKIENYKLNKKDGKFTFLVDGIKQKEEIWKNNYKTNDYTYFTKSYKKGRIWKSRQFNKEGNIHGEFSTYDEAGLVSKAKYKNGKKEGDEFIYENGKKTKVNEYDNNILVRSFRLYNGKKITKNILVNTQWFLNCHKNSRSSSDKIPYKVKFYPNGKLTWRSTSDNSSYKRYGELYGGSSKNRWKVVDIEELEFEVKLWNPHADGFRTLYVKLNDDLVSISGTTNYSSYDYLRGAKAGYVEGSF